MKIRRVDKIRILVLLPLSLAFLVVGSILISSTGEDDKQSILPGVDSTTELLTTEVRDILAQAPEPPSPTPLPTTVLEPPSPTPIPTDIPGLSCSSKFAYSGSGSNLTYAFQIDTTSENNRTTMTIDLRPYLANNNIQILEYSGNCEPVSNDGLFTCDQLNYPALIFFKVINEYQGALDFKAEVEKIHTDNSREGATCNNSITIQGINTPPTGLPPYSPQPTFPPGSSTQDNCNPYKEYCNPPGANLIDDVLFNQSHDGSFENPICTLNPDGSIGGKGCGSLLDRASYYQADTSALIPFNSQAFFVDSGEYQRPEYIIQEVAGGQQCEEKLVAHGNNSFKIFSRGGFGLKGGLCLPMKSAGSTIHAGLNYRVSQQTSDTSSNVDVTFKLGYITSAPVNNFYQGTTPSLSESSITWVDTQLVTKDDYGSEEGAAARYTGGFLEADFPSSAKGFCFMADSVGGNGINTFWDAGFAYTGDEPVCENALDHSDGIDRSCGGFECGNTEPILAGNNYTDFNQEFYAFDMPANWNAKQCEYKTETNGAPSQYGTLFVGLDMNSCDPNYAINNQREINPEFNCADMRNWTYGFAWTGGIKDFGLLQFLDCSLKRLDESRSILEEGNAFKGTESSPFFCDSILKSYSNSKNTVGIEDPGFTLRYTNTYSGLVNAIQAEGNNNFWKVPLLGSAVANRIINNRQDESLLLDPYLIGKRNSGSGMNNAQKFNLEDFVVSQALRLEEHLFDSSIIPRKEVMVADLLANGPVCRNIEGDPITKIHYGSSSGQSDRAVFGFADDEGSFEHEVEKNNEEITPEQLCDYQFLDNRVVGAECTILDIGDGKDVTFTEGNIGASLESQGYVGRIAAPTLPPPTPSGIPDPDFETCPPVSLCGADFTCSNTMRDLYNACRANRPEYNIDEIGGNPFIRWKRPNGWKDLEIAGLNKVMEAGWQNEFIHYNQVVRHENVGLDVNQVVSVYDQQQPKCSTVPGAYYCTTDSMVNKAAQVCRRAEPYNCNCQPSNYSTCLLACQQMFTKPQDVPDVGLPIEGEIVPTVPGNGPQPADTAIRPILDNTHKSFLERFISLLEEKTYEGEGGENYETGQVYSYDPRFTGGFLLANTSGTNASQCSATNEGATGVSQVRLENYYAYGGQMARINERVGFAATNNKDGKTSDQLIVNPDAALGEITDFILRGGEAYEHIALPYCDLLPQSTRDACSTNTNVSCDCLVRTCDQKYNDQVKLLDTYLPLICEKIRDINLDDDPGNNIPISTDISACKAQLRDHWVNIRFKPEYEQCLEIPRNNLNFNCDPMANFLMDQGFDTPELRLAACDEILNNAQCSYDKFGVHLITGPTQEDKYTRAENIGLKWKMEVIVDDSATMQDAMAQSINSFNGKSVFRFCNADQGSPGAKFQDQSCQFRTEITGSSAESGKKVAQMVMAVARKTSKSFAVSPINEPISEHWYGGNPNDLTFADTMPAVSEFYTAFVNELDTDANIKSRIEVGGPTFNVTAFNNYDNFTRMYNEFGPKDLVDFWTVTMYNNNDLPEDMQVMEKQFAKVKEVITSKPIALNETGDFQHDISRLQTSYAALGSDSRLKYALLFNAFGGLGGDPRGEALILTDAEIKTVLSSGRECTGTDGNLQCIEGGIYGLIQAVANGLNAVEPQISAEAIYALGIHEGFGNGLSGDPNEMAQTNATLGNDTNGDRQISPPCTTASNAGCEYDVRGVMQFQNFTFYSVITSNYDLMKNCTDAIGVDYGFKGPVDEGMVAMFGGDMDAYESFLFSRNRVGDNICVAAIFVANLGRTETGGSVSPEAWEQEALSFTLDDGSNFIYRIAGRYLGVTDYDTCTKGDTTYQYCNQVTDSMKETYERGTFQNISGEECTNFLGYSGTCEEIFNQVKQEPAYSAISTANYSEEVSPYYDDTFAALSPGSHMCSMTMFGTNQTMYCFEKGTGGEQIPLSICQNCPVRATALFRHELNHAITPLGALGRTWSEFSADAVSNNGGWYMFNYQGSWMFATQIVERLATSTNIPVSTIHDYLNGKIANPGINFQAEVTGICHYNGGDAIGVNPCPTKQVPPGLEQSNCQNVGTPPTGELPDPILLGLSAGGREINAYKFGSGPNKLLFVGGMHGGYEWNSIQFAYEAIEYFADHSEAVPNSATLYIIPSANPDGQARAGLGTGPFPPGNYPRSIDNRYNDNGVDLNRNFDCNWTANPSGPNGNELTGKGGTSPFSESESKILRDFIRTHKPKASIFWHSVANFISPAGCGDLLYPPSVELSDTYGGYHVITQQEIDDNNGGAFSYDITGDITNWMETEGYVGTTVELASANRSEFERNIPGMLKVLQKYGKSAPIPSGGPQPI